MKFIETSAKEASNVEKAFLTMSEEIIDSKVKNKEKLKPHGTQINPNVGNDLSKDKKSCC